MLLPFLLGFVLGYVMMTFLQVIHIELKPLWHKLIIGFFMWPLWYSGFLAINYVQNVNPDNEHRKRIIGISGIFTFVTLFIP